MSSTMKVSQLEEELLNFHGSGVFYRFTVNLIYTEGIQFLLHNAKAYWLLDIILSYQTNELVNKERFQVYRLSKAEDSSAIIEISDGNNNIIATQEIPFTDFPLNTITLWCVDGTILLPSEY